MKVTLGAVVVYLALFLLTIYNIRRNYRLVKLRTNAQIREPEKLSEPEQGQLQRFAQTKRKWSILGQVMFFISLFLFFKGTIVELAFFMDLYTVSMIMVNNSEIEIIKLLGQPAGSH